MCWSKHFFNKMRWIRGLRFQIFLVFTLPTFKTHLSIITGFKYLFVLFLKSGVPEWLFVPVCMFTHVDKGTEYCVYMCTLGKERDLETFLTWGRIYKVFWIHKYLEQISILLLEGMRHKSSQNQVKLMKQSQILCCCNFIKGKCSCPHIHSWEVTWMTKREKGVSPNVWFQTVFFTVSTNFNCNTKQFLFITHFSIGVHIALHFMGFKWVSPRLFWYIYWLQCRPYLEEIYYFHYDSFYCFFPLTFIKII